MSWGETAFNAIVRQRTTALRCGVVFYLLCFCVVSLYSVDDSSRRERYRQAVAQARAGNYAAAKKIVSETLALPPVAPEVLFDYIVIFAQAGQVAEAIKDFESLPITVTPPEYVVKEAVICYARQGNYARAAGLYDRYLKGKEGSRSGRDAVMDRYLAARRFDLAAAYARESENKQEGSRQEAGGGTSRAPERAVSAAPSTIEELFRQGKRFEQEKELLAAYGCYEKILFLVPATPDARNLKYRVLLRAGCYSLVRDMLERTGDRIDPSIMQELRGDEAMSRLRWEEPDNALAIIEANLRYAREAQLPAATLVDFSARCAHDRIRAWKLKGEWQKVIDEQNAFFRSPAGAAAVSPPPWVLMDVGRACLSLGKAREALSLCDGCWCAPNNLVYDDLQMLYYESLIAAGRYDEARRAAENYDKTVPPEIVERGIVKDNRLKEEIARNRGWELIKQDRFDEAEKYFTALLARAPYSSGTRAALAHAYLGNDRPKAALQEFAISRTIGPDAMNEAGYCRALYENARYAEAYALAGELAGRYPNDKEIAVLRRELDGSRLYGLSADAGTTREFPGASEVGATLRVSKPVGYGRVVYGEYLWRDTRQEIEGRALSDTLSRAGIGMEWKAFSEWSFAGEVSAGRNSYPGFAGSVAYRPFDTLALSCFYDSFSLFVPLQARANGITASERYIALRLGPRMGAVMEGKYDILAMSDGNEQRFADLKLSRHLAADERGRLILALEGNYVSNTETAVPYFSPAALYAAYLLPEAEVALYRGQSTTVSGRLGAGLGREWQEGFPAANVWFVRYEQDHRLANGVTLGTGIRYSLPNFDGVETEVWNVTFSAGTGF